MPVLQPLEDFQQTSALRLAGIPEGQGLVGFRETISKMPELNTRDNLCSLTSNFRIAAKKPVTRPEPIDLALDPNYLVDLIVFEGQQWMPESLHRTKSEQ